MQHPESRTFPERSMSVARNSLALCLLLTVSLITTIFYFHPATTAVISPA